MCYSITGINSGTGGGENYSISSLGKTNFRSNVYCTDGASHNIFYIAIGI